MIMHFAMFCIYFVDANVESSHEALFFLTQHNIVSRYMVKSTTMALRKNECAFWKVDNTGFVSHLTEEA